MKMNKLTKVAILALTAASFASMSASAANVSTSPTDLVLGFAVTDNSGTGSASNLEIDLGSFSLFTTTATLTLNQLAVQDLVSTYGANWATRGDLTFGISGLTSTTSNNFEATYSGSGPQNSSNLSLPYAKIGGLVGGLGGVAQTSNSAQAGVVATSQGNSFTSEVTDNAGDYGFFNPAGVTEVNGGSGVTTGSIDLFSFTEKSVPRGQLNPADQLGTFSLSSGGVLTYNGINAQAVPEPSAYALGICAVLLFLVLKRRHSVA